MSLRTTFRQLRKRRALTGGPHRPAPHLRPSLTRAEAALPTPVAPPVPPTPRHSACPSSLSHWEVSDERLNLPIHILARTPHFPAHLAHRCMRRPRRAGPRP